jgi:hypothetical protein
MIEDELPVQSPLQFTDAYARIALTDCLAVLEHCVDKSNPPMSIGVFKPVGHVVVALPSMQAVEAARARLLADGFQHSDLVRYTPHEMRAQVNEEIRTAGLFASIGQTPESDESGLDLDAVHRRPD